MDDGFSFPQRFLFCLLLGAAGLYAGILLMYTVGIAPMIDGMDASAFLRFWQTHDYFVHLRIRFVYAVLGALYLLTLLSMATRVRTRRFALLAFACLLFCAEIAVNRVAQRPVNHSIRLSDTGNHSAESIYAMERQLFHALHLRQAFSAGAFGLLCIASMLPCGARAERAA